MVGGGVDDLILEQAVQVALDVRANFRDRIKTIAVVYAIDLVSYISIDRLRIRGIHRCDTPAYIEG